MKAGQGNPRLCRLHEQLVAEEFEETIDTEDLVEELAGRAGEFMDRISAGLGNLFNQQPAIPAAVQAAMRARAAAQQARARAAGAARGQRPPPRQPPPPAPTPKRDELGEAMDVLGFQRGAKVTKEQVKARQKALAKVFHPDAGGDVDAMRRVNVAVKTVLAVLS